MNSVVLQILKGVSFIILFMSGHLNVRAQEVDFSREKKCLSIWNDKPMIKADTSALISHDITRISVYSYSINDSGYTKELLGYWNLSVKDGKISSAKAEGKNHFRCLTVSKIINKKNRTIEYAGDREQNHRFTHYLDDKGQIIKTENKNIKDPFENRYDFDKIEYKYDKGLLVEAIYYNDDRYINKNTAYYKLGFEYK